MRNLIVTTATLLFAGTPALAGGTYEIEPPVPVEAHFPGSTAREVSSILALICSDMGATVTDRSEFNVTCSGQSNGVIFNRYTRQRELVSFSIIERPSGPSVRPSSTLETTNGFGQVSVSGGNEMERIIDKLNDVGATWPNGTKVVGYDLGIIGGMIEGGLTASPLWVNGVRPGSAAEAAGLQKDDRILSVNGRKFAFYSTFRDALMATPPGGQAMLEVKRKKVKDRLQVAIEARAPKVNVAPQ